MRAIWNHYLDSETLVASSEEDLYPASYLQIPLLYKTWRSTGITAETIVIDAGVGNTFTFDCCAVSNHNLTSGATIKFQMHTSDSWGAPDLDETVTWRSGHLIHYFTSTTKRFARFYFNDAANTDGYIEAGRISASQYLQFDPSSLYEHSIEVIRNDVVIDTPSNNRYGTLTGGYRVFNYEFPGTAFTMLNNLRTMYAAVGKVTPIYFMNYDTAFTKIAPAYVCIDNNITEDWRGNKASYSLSLRETGGFNGG